jgi:hypothetical protein
MARKPEGIRRGRAAPDRPDPKPLYEEVVVPEARPPATRGGYGGDDDIDERYRYSEPDFSPLHDKRPFDERLGGHAELACEPKPRNRRRPSAAPAKRAGKPPGPRR